MDTATLDPAHAPALVRRLPATQDETRTAARRAMTRSDPDHETLRRVAAGDLDAFEALVRRHERRLLRLCERMLGSADEAQEAVQDVFFKAWRKAAGFRPRAKVSTWLYRIAVNHCLNRLRRRKVVQFFSFGDVAGRSDTSPAAGRPDGTTDGVPDFDPPDTAPDAERRLADRRRWRRLRRALDALPASQRAVLVLVRFEGLSYRQTAETLGITQGAVESRLFRAMRRLEQTPGVLSDDADEADQADTPMRDSPP